MLAYAMTLALPESFTTLKQTLWLREPLTSSAVQAAVQAEWTRRSSEEVAMANRVQESRTQGNTSNRRAKLREWTEKWCSIHKVPTHNTRDCSLRKFNNNQVDLPGNAYPVQLADTLSEWHHKLGHLGIEKVVRLAKEGRLGQNNQLKNANAGNIKDFYCEACIKRKLGNFLHHLNPTSELLGHLNYCMSISGDQHQLLPREVCDTS